MQYLNFISPFLIGIDRIQLSEDTEFNFALRHYLTSFGYDLTSDFFIRHKDKNYLISLHKYTNKNGSYPGLELSVPYYQHNWKKKRLDIEQGIMLWMQPSYFYSTNAKFGAQLSATARLSINNWLGYYISAEGKTKGWVAGNPYLNDKLGCRIGLRASIR